jgi:hypothetical protein
VNTSSFSNERDGAETVFIPRGAVLAGAMAIGVAADLLLRSASGPGLNLFLMFGVLTVAVGLVKWVAGLELSRESLGWMATGLCFAGAIALRASPVLQLLAFLAASAAFAAPALRAGAPWLRRSGVSDFIEAIGSAVLHSITGPLRLLLERLAHDEGSAGSRGDRTANHPHPRERPGWAVARGLLLALPLLLVFGALLMSADRIFADMVLRLLPAGNLEEVAERLVLVGAFSWLAFGYLSGFVRGTRIRGRLEPMKLRPSLGILETGTALALVDLLFAAFVAVQLRYLFGGSALVEVTPGLTYSEYAREGFGQLVLAAGLVLPLLLTSDWLLRREGPRDAQVFRILGGVQLVLLAVVIASAIQRVRVYGEAYGLTESRFYGAAFLVWLTLLVLWFAGTVLRDRREHFGPVAVVSAFAVLALLLAVNPDRQIARTNLTRATSLYPSAELDTAYLGSLSADAVPTLVRALPDLPSDVRCRLAEEVRRRWDPEGGEDWRSWNLSASRARRLVTEAPVGAASTTGCTGPAHER